MKSEKINLRCDCEGQLLEICYDPKDDIPASVSFVIYEKWSPKGRKYKKPHSVSDVVIMNNKYPNELDKLLKFFKEIEESHVKPNGR